MKQYLMRVVWPAFIGAALCTVALLFFAESANFIASASVEPGDEENLRVYSYIFLIAWVISIVPCSVTWLLCHERDIVSKPSDARDSL